MKFTYKNIEEIDKIYLHDWIFMGMIYEREKCTCRMIVQDYLENKREITFAEVEHLVIEDRNSYIGGEQQILDWESVPPISYDGKKSNMVRIRILFATCAEIFIQCYSIEIL